MLGQAPSQNQIGLDLHSIQLVLSTFNCRYDLDKDEKVSFDEILKADEALRKEEEATELEEQARPRLPHAPVTVASPSCTGAWDPLPTLDHAYAK